MSANGGQGYLSLAERTLHQHSVDPATELEADRRQERDLNKSVRRVQAAEPTIVNVNPTLWSGPGALALSWSRGHYINVCGGCVTDNTMQFVALDPADLAPISDVVEITADAGLRSAPIVSADGDDFAYLMAIDRHATFDLASALVRCGPAS